MHTATHTHIHPDTCAHRIQESKRTVARTMLGSHEKIVQDLVPRLDDDAIERLMRATWSRVEQDVRCSLITCEFHDHER